ncbi:hypothetical protein PFISCL1PPCAC_18731, partial [Pristionchus fissidentatus]
SHSTLLRSFPEAATKTEGFLFASLHDARMKHTVSSPHRSSSIRYSKQFELLRSNKIRILVIISELRPCIKDEEKREM